MNPADVAATGVAAAGFAQGSEVSLLSMFWSAHIVVKISPYHQSSISSHLNTGLQLLRHFGNQATPPSAIYGTNYVASLPWSYPRRIEVL